MYAPDLERMTLEFHLMTAQRRADRLTRGSPSWDAAMCVVDELQLEGARLDARSAWPSIATIRRPNRACR
jgi:hypothetical protein